MRFRTLYGALTLLFFVAPLSASFCADCISGHCMMIGTSEVSEPSPAPAGPSCHGAEEAPPEEPAEDAAPCHNAAPAMASTDCCSLTTTASEPEIVTAPASSMVSEIALEAAVDAELPDAEHQRPGPQRQSPPPQAPQPLYTLHSSFLI